MDLEIINKIIITVGWIDDEIRSIKYTPAVTNVEEWTKAEIGVGAAIAIGNQAEKGNCALFEQAAIISKMRMIIMNSWFMEKFQFDVMVIIAKDIRIKISPIRLLNKVIVPDEADLKFW